MLQALLLSLLAGLAIPAGGFLARAERLRPGWLESELRHSVIAFGGGALMAAVALVLVPEGVKLVPPALAVGLFFGGGVLFLFVDRALARHPAGSPQTLAMLLDFVPESVALGASFASGSPAGPLLALLIGLQNFPEGFNAYRELIQRGEKARRTLITFLLLALLGPFSAWIGITVFADLPELLGALMLASAGGILYLTFQDIAPQAKLESAWGPALGAVAGFALGLLGHLFLD